jgi:hypothetical protein
MWDPDLKPRTRSIVVWTLVGLGTLTVLVGSLTLWVKRQALDTDSWVDTSTQLLADDDVRQALSVYLVDQLYANLDPQEALAQGLPPNLQGLAAPLAGALREPTVRAVDSLLQRPRVQQLWEEVNRRAHEALLRLLNDEPRIQAISTAGGAVTLDLRPLLIQIGEQLGIGERLDERLPADAAQFTILRSDQLKAAQDGVKIVKVGSAFIVFIALLLYAAAVWLARGRRETLRNVGVALLLVGILLFVIRRVAGSYIVDALASGEPVRDAANATWLIGTSLLIQVAWALVLYGIVLVIGTWAAGPSRYPTRFRGWLAPTLRDRPGIGWAVLAAVYLLLVLWAPVPALRNWVGVLLLAGLVALGFEAFRRVTLSGAPARVLPGGDPPARPAA